MTSMSKTVSVLVLFLNLHKKILWACTVLMKPAKTKAGRAKRSSLKSRTDSLIFAHSRCVHICIFTNFTSLGSYSIFLLQFREKMVFLKNFWKNCWQVILLRAPRNLFHLTDLTWFTSSSTKDHTDARMIFQSGNRLLENHPQSHGYLST